MKAEEYTYKLPDNYIFKPETRAKLDKVVDDLGLSNEQAQAFVDIHVELMEEYAAQIDAERQKSKKAAPAAYAPEGTLSSSPRREKYGTKA